MRGFKLNSDKNLRRYVFSKLKLEWSPEQIAGRLKLERHGKSAIVHETIYAYIYSDYGIHNQWYACLRRKRLLRYPKIGRKQRTLIPNRIPISERPVEINQRQTFGHWEGDLMMFQRGVKTNLITLRERKSRYLIAIKNTSRKADETAQRIISRLKPIKDKVISITFDNGVEFCHHEQIKLKLNTQHYFCEPYKSWQKGSIENANRLLRHYFPRDIEPALLTKPHIKKSVQTINHRPMKCLNFKTPYEIFIEYL